MKKSRKNSKFAYGLGAISFGAGNAFVSSFLTIYLTDYLGITGTAIGTMYLIARIWDAVNDPMMGVIVDKTRTPWGKYKPYLLISPIVIAVAMIMLFTAPDFEMTGKIVWAYVFYLIFGMAYTAYGIPYMAYSYRISETTEERTKYISFYSIFNIIASCTVAMGGLAAITGLGGNGAAYRKVAIVLGIVGIVCAFVNGLRNKEVDNALSEEKQSNSLSDYKKLVVQNKPFLRMLVLNVLVVAAVNVPLSFLLYYLRYVLRDESPYIVIMAINLVMQFSVMILASKIISKIGKKATMILSLVMQLAGFLIYYFAFRNVSLIYAGTIFTGIGSGLFTVALTTLTADTVDYSEWKYGNHSEGVVFSLTSFANKVATAICGAIAGYGLDIIGYRPNEIQSDATIFGFRVLLTWIPIVLIMISIPVFWKYELDNKTMKQMEAELTARKKNAADGVMDNVKNN